MPYTTIPLQFLVQCYWCRILLDSRSDRTYQRVEAWLLNGNGGLSLEHRFKVWACRNCIQEQSLKHKKWQPETGYAECHFRCGQKVDKLAAGVYQLCMFWVTGNRGSTGGQGARRHTRALPIRLQAWSCGECIKRQVAGISVEQGTLF